MVSAVCAELMSPEESALLTLVRNSPRGLLESAFDGVSFSTCARYVLAAVVSPDLMAVLRLVNAESNEFWLLDELVAEVEDVVSSARRALVL